MIDRAWVRGAEASAPVLLVLQFTLVLLGDHTTFAFRLAFATLLIALGVIVIAAVRRHEATLADLLACERAARTAADVANRAKDEAFLTLSHELRAPLSAIVGWLHLLQSGKLDAAATRRALDTIQRNATSQATLITNMFGLSRLLADKVLLDVRPLDLGTLIEQTVESLRPDAEARRIDVATALAPCGRVRGDADRLVQVLQNLLANAIKFTPSGGHILIRLTGNATHTTISVRDDGPGIAPDQLPFVFDRFRQAGADGARCDGLGLGLTIVRHLVELHGGTVHAQSAGGDTGAEFVVTLSTDLVGSAEARSPEPAGTTPLAFERRRPVNISTKKRTVSRAPGTEAVAS